MIDACKACNPRSAPATAKRLAGSRICGGTAAACCARSPSFPARSLIFPALVSRAAIGAATAKCELRLRAAPAGALGLKPTRRVETIARK